MVIDPSIYWPSCREPNLSRSSASFAGSTPLHQIAPPRHDWTLRHEKSRTVGRRSNARVRCAVLAGDEGPGPHFPMSVEAFVGWALQSYGTKEERWQSGWQRGSRRARRSPSPKGEQSHQLWRAQKSSGAGNAANSSNTRYYHAMKRKTVDASDPTGARRPTRTTSIFVSRVIGSAANAIGRRRGPRGPGGRPTNAA